MLNGSFFLRSEEGGVRNVTAFELFSYLRSPVPPHLRTFNVQCSTFNVLVHVRLVIASVASCAGRRAWVAVTSASLVPLSSGGGLGGASIRGEASTQILHIHERGSFLEHL